MLSSVFGRGCCLPGVACKPIIRYAVYRRDTKLYLASRPVCLAEVIYTCVRLLMPGKDHAGEADTINATRYVTLLSFPVLNLRI